MIRGAAALSFLGLVAIGAACGRSSGVPDDQLGALVIEPKRPDPKIDVGRASNEPAELARALVRPHAVVLAAIGPHTASVNTKTVVEEAGKVVSELSDQATIRNGEHGAFHGVYNSSADYGRETKFVVPAAGDPGKLYLRPRYQRWHGRPPEAPDEPVALRDAYYDAIAATWELVGFAAELTDRGVVQIGERAGRKIEIKLSPSAGKPGRETLAQRKWREGRTVEALSGEVVLDPDHGVPLALKLAGSIGFSREGRSFVMKVELDSTLSGIGPPAVIAAPADNEVVATPGRLREVDDRDYLLQGIAPPLRRNSDGTGVAPSPAAPAPPAGSAAEPAKSPGKAAP